MVLCHINCFWFDETDSLSEILSAENSDWAECLKYFVKEKGKKKPQMSLWLTSRITFDGESVKKNTVK